MISQSVRQRVFLHVAHHLGVSPFLIPTKRRTAMVALARKVTMHRLRELGFSSTEVAECLQCHPSNVRYGLESLAVAVAHAREPLRSNLQRAMQESGVPA